MTKKTDPLIEDAIESALPEFKELRLLEEEMREGIKNYVEQFKKTLPFVDRLKYLGASEDEIQEMKDGHHDKD